MVAELVEQGARTICFIKSRRAVELIARYVQQNLRERSSELAERVAPYRAGYTPPQRRELERAAHRRRAARRRDDGRAGAGHRHRRARRRGQRHVPRHRRLAAPACGAAPAGAAAGWRCTSPARTRSTSSSAAIPTSSSAAPSRRRSSTTRSEHIHATHLLVRRPRGAARRRPTRVPRARACVATPSGSSRAGELRERDGDATCRAGPRTSRRRACRCARPRPTASRSSTVARAS